MKTISHIINGRFGNKVLKDKYKTYWQFFTYGSLIVLFVRFVMFPFFEVWEKFITFLNLIIWG